MQRYTNKKIAIEAVLWGGDNFDEVQVFVGPGVNQEDPGRGSDLIVPTPAGEMRAKVGDWIVKNADGAFSICAPSLFEDTYIKGEHEDQAPKTLDNTSVKKACDQVADLELFGNGDLFKLITKASSLEEGWMKSTKAMGIEGLGVALQVTTQQRNIDGTYAVAEALTFLPGAKINEVHAEPGSDDVVERTIVYPQDDCPTECKPSIEDVINNQFTYHAPKGQLDIDRYKSIRDSGRTFALLIAKVTPPGADRDEAIRKVREAVMTANAAVACAE